MGGKVYCDELGSYYGLLFPQTGNFLCVYPTYFYFWGIPFICIFTQCSYKQLQAVQNIKWGSALLYFCSPLISVWSKANFKKTAAKKKKYHEHFLNLPIFFSDLELQPAENYKGDNGWMEVLEAFPKGQ